MNNDERRKATRTITSDSEVSEGDTIVWLDGLGNRVSAEVILVRGFKKIEISSRSQYTVKHMLSIHGSLGVL